MISSLYSENYKLLKRGTDKQGRPMCFIQHQTAETARVIYALLFRPTRACPEGKWHQLGFFSSIEEYIIAPESGGKALSGSRQHLNLLTIAEAAS